MDIRTTWYSIGSFQSFAFSLSVRLQSSLFQIAHHTRHAVPDDCIACGTRIQLGLTTDAAGRRETKNRRRQGKARQSNRKGQQIIKATPKTRFYFSILSVVVFLY